jgi:hypothetical protein
MSKAMSGEATHADNEGLSSATGLLKRDNSILTRLAKWTKIAISLSWLAVSA